MKSLCVRMLLASCILGLGLLPAVLPAQEADSPESVALPPNLSPDELQKLLGKVQNGEKADKDFPPLEEVVKDMEKRKGFINLYVDPKKNKLMAELPGSVLGKDLLVATSMSAGQRAGFQWNDMMIRFERRDDKVLVFMPDTFYTAEGDLKSVVKRTYPDPLIATVKIEAEAPSNGVVVDLKSLLIQNASTFIGFAPSSMYEEIAKAKAFPKNSVVELTFQGRSGTTGVYFDFHALPDGNYKPRVADQRVGYFLTARKNFSKDRASDTIFDRYINRWNLEKADPSLDLSPPKEPIVFYIEDSWPVKYRHYVRQGIEEWNRAFEKIGIVGAIVVRQQTENNEFSDLDPEDARYNFIRWITTESAFAMGPSRVDPRSGQILDADIIFDESMVRSYVRAYDLLFASTEGLSDLSPQMRHWLAANPWEHPNWPRLSLEYAQRIQSDPKLADKSPARLFAEDLLESTTSHMDHRYCSIGQAISRELAFAGLAMDYMMDQGAEDEGDESGDSEDSEDNEDSEENGEEESPEKKEDKKSELDKMPEEYLGQIIREIVAHEVGHTLGLRHNFKASTWKTYEEIAQSSDPNSPTVGSVMDYNPVTLLGDGSTPQLWITPTIGPYDEWAIEYGYAIPGTSGYQKDEAKMLKEITAKAGQPGLQYGTDEDVWSADPSTNRFDLGSDPLEYEKARVALSDKIMDKLLEAIVDENESYAKARDAYTSLFYQRWNLANRAVKYVGGHTFARVYKGNGDERTPISVVPATEQREAMDILVKTVFAADAFKIDPQLQRHLAASRWSHQGSTDWYQPLALPIQDMILDMQNSVIFSLTTPSRIQNIYDMPYRVDADDDVYTLAELFTTLGDSIWNEVKNPPSGKFTVRQPMINDLRRNLQRSYLGRMITIATSGEQSIYPAIARTLVWKEMKDLGGEIENMLKEEGNRLDAYTLAHLEESSTRIRKALDANYTVGSPSSRGGFIIYAQPTGNGAPDENTNPYMRRVQP